MIEMFIALLVGLGTFAAITRRQQEKGWVAGLEWELDHDTRSSCKYCEHDVYLNHKTVPGVWTHLATEQVMGKTPHGQPHAAFPWPFSNDRLYEAADKVDREEAAAAAAAKYD